MQVYVFFSILEFTKDAITSTQPTFYLDISVSIRDLHQKKLVQRSSLILLLVLATTVMRRGKRSVVHVTQCIAALVLVQGSSSLFSNVYCLFDPGQRTGQKYYMDQRQYTFEKRDDDPWTRTRASTRWATHTTDFLPRRISIVARSGRTEQASSDEGLWQRLKYQGKNVGCVEVIVSYVIINHVSWHSRICYVMQNDNMQADC